MVHAQLQTHTTQRHFAKTDAWMKSNFPKIKDKHEATNQLAQRKSWFHFNSSVVGQIARPRLQHICVCTHSLRQAYPLHECQGRGSEFSDYLFSVPSLISLGALENPVGIFKLGHGSDYRQNKQWLEENLQKSDYLHYSHSQPSPHHHSHGKPYCLGQIKLSPMVEGYCFLLLCEFLASDNGTTRDRGQEKCLFVSQTLCYCGPQGLAYALVVCVHLGITYVKP